jgi:hypothetical protein
MYVELNTISSLWSSVKLSSIWKYKIFPAVNVYGSFYIVYSGHILREEGNSIH